MSDNSIPLSNTISFRLLKSLPDRLSRNTYSQLLKHFLLILPVERIIRQRGVTRGVAVNLSKLVRDISTRFTMTYSTWAIQLFVPATTFSTCWFSRVIGNRIEAGNAKMRTIYGESQDIARKRWRWETAITLLKASNILGRNDEWALSLHFLTSNNVTAHSVDWKIITTFCRNQLTNEELIAALV